MVENQVKVGTHQHLFILTNCETFSLHHLKVLKATEDVMLDFEGDLHSELSTLFDAERLFFESLESPRSRQVNGNIGSPFNLEGKCVYNAAAFV